MNYTAVKLKAVLIGDYFKFYFRDSIENDASAHACFQASKSARGKPKLTTKPKQSDQGWGSV